MVAQHLGKPLTTIPDPFGTHDSFGHHNNARLRGFLDGFGFQYEFPVGDRLVTGPAGSTPRCWPCSATTTRSWR